MDHQDKLDHKYVPQLFFLLDYLWDIQPNIVLQKASQQIRLDLKT